MELTLKMGAAIVVYPAVCQVEFDWMPWNSRAPYYEGLEKPTQSTKGQIRASESYTWLTKIVVLMIYSYPVSQRQLNYEIQRILIFDANLCKNSPYLELCTHEGLLTLVHDIQTCCRVGPVSLAMFCMAVLERLRQPDRSILVSEQG